MSSSSNRLLGIEFAYTFAIIGCVLYIFTFTIGDIVRSVLSHQEYSPVFDFFPAMFIFLNGMTVTITMRDKRISKRKLLGYLGKRGSVLFLIGLALCVIWPMNIFIVAGMLYFLSQYLALWNNIILRILTLVLIALGIILLFFNVPTTVEYSGPVLQGGNLMNLSGFLFYNGYFSILPWAIFFLIGMQYGRSSVSGKGIFPPSSFLGIGLIALAFILQRYTAPLQEQFIGIIESDSVYLKNRFVYLAFVFYASGMALCLINAFLFLFKTFTNKAILKYSQIISSFKFSIFFFQILIGILTMAITNSPIFMNKVVLLVYVLIATFSTLYLAVLWKNKVNDLGPVEYVVKRISGSTKNS